MWTLLKWLCWIGLIVLAIDTLIGWAGEEWRRMRGRK